MFMEKENCSCQNQGFKKNCDHCKPFKLEAFNHQSNNMIWNQFLRVSKFCLSKGKNDMRFELPWFSFNLNEICNISSILTLDWDTW
jgi:hypothetical protein